MKRIRPIIEKARTIYKVLDKNSICSLGRDETNYRKKTSVKKTIII